MSVPFDVLRRLRSPRFAPGRTRYVSSRSAEARALGVMQSLGAMFNVPPSEAALDTYDSYGEDGGNYAPVRQSGPEPIDPGESIGPLLVDPSAVRAAERAGLSGCCGLSGLSDNEKKYGMIAVAGVGLWLLWKLSKKSRLISNPGRRRGRRPAKRRRRAAKRRRPAKRRRRAVPKKRRRSARRAVPKKRRRPARRAAPKKRRRAAYPVTSLNLGWDVIVPSGGRFVGYDTKAEAEAFARAYLDPPYRIVPG